MTEEQIEAIRKRAEKSRGNWYTDFNAMRNASHVINEDIPALLAEVERLRREISFIAHVDLLKNAYDEEHIALSVQSWALNVLDGINHDGK